MVDGQGKVCGTSSQSITTKISMLTRLKACFLTMGLENIQDTNTQEKISTVPSLNFKNQPLKTFVFSIGITFSPTPAFVYASPFL